MSQIQRFLSLMRRIRSPPQFAAAARSARPNDSSSTSLLTVFIGFSMNTAFAENAAEAELVAANEQGEAYVTGLRRIEDGSVVSNSHTIKWRIFTDNGRALFMKSKLDEAEKFFQSAIDEAKEGWT